MSAHTPGPWAIDVTRASKRAPASMLMIVAEAGGMPGLIVNSGPVEPRDWANARLIAEAPAMFDLLRQLHVASTYAFNTEYVVERARAILARIEDSNPAKGGSMERG